MFLVMFLKTLIKSFTYKDPKIIWLIILSDNISLIETISSGLYSLHGGFSPHPELRCYWPILGPVQNIADIVVLIPNHYSISGGFFFLIFDMLIVIDNVIGFPLWFSCCPLSIYYWPNGKTCANGGIAGRMRRVSLLILACIL